MGWVEYQRRRIAGEERNVPWFVGNKLKAYEFAKANDVDTPVVYAQFKSADDLDFSAAPEYFVCKPLGLHSTMGVMLLHREADGTFYDSLKKRVLSAEQIVSEQRHWYEKTPFKNSYRIVLEEYLLPESGKRGVVPHDYKMYCFRDRVELITQIDRNVKPALMSWLDGGFQPLDWPNYIETDWKVVHEGTPSRPDCWAAMLGAAKRLSVALDTPFVSVDMYATPRGPVLGELTLAPGGPYHGTMYRFKPFFDEHLGRMWAYAEGLASRRGNTRETAWHQPGS